MPNAPSTAPNVLRGPVGRQLAPGEALGGRERERDGRVDVAARHLAERVHERGDDEAERERDAEQVRACDGRRAVAGEDQRRHDRAGSDEHQQRGAEGLGQRSLAERVGLHLFLLWKDWDRLRFDNVECGLQRTPLAGASQAIPWGFSKRVASGARGRPRAPRARRPARRPGGRARATRRPSRAGDRGSASSAVDLRAQPLRRQLVVAQDRGGARLRHPARVGGLVVGGGVRIGHEHGRQAVLGELEDRAAGARDGEVGGERARSRTGRRTRAARSAGRARAGRRSRARPGTCSTWKGASAKRLDGGEVDRARAQRAAEDQHAGRVRRDPERRAGGRRGRRRAAARGGR